MLDDLLQIDPEKLNADLGGVSDAPALESPPVQAESQASTEPASTEPAATAESVPDPQAELVARIGKLETELGAARNLNERIVAALERLGQPAQQPEPEPEDPFKGLDPHDPDDKIEILRRGYEIQSRELAALRTELGQRDASAQAAQTTNMAGAQLRSFVEDAAKRMGLGNDEADTAIKAEMFQRGVDAWRAHGYVADMAHAAQSAVAGIERMWGTARHRAVRPVVQSSQRQPPPPVRGGAVTPPPQPPRSINVLDEDEVIASLRTEFGSRQNLH